MNKSDNNKEIDGKRRRNGGGPQVMNMPKKKKIKINNLQNNIMDNEESE
jgi:hypothetical protein